MTMIVMVLTLKLKDVRLVVHVVLANSVTVYYSLFSFIAVEVVDTVDICLTPRKSNVQQIRLHHSPPFQVWKLKLNPWSTCP